VTSGEGIRWMVNKGLVKDKDMGEGLGTNIKVDAEKTILQIH